MSQINWQRLSDLRNEYVSGKRAIEDYWDESLLNDYHSTFAQRIKWKWQSVLKLSQEDVKLVLPEQVKVLDWGCGTGVASEAFCQLFGEDVLTLHLWDRSAKAMSFARERISEKFPNIRIKCQSVESPDVLLVSHVLTEMDEEATGKLIALAKSARLVLWVDAGTYSVSRRLIQVRENLKAEFKVIAPCLHQETCGMLVSDNQNDWCHFFAESPRDVFHSGFWREFAKKLSVDLRSLPVSFLILAKPNHKSSVNGARLIGRVREYKGHCKALVCDSTGVHERTIQKRDHKELFKKLCRKQNFCHAFEQESVN